jgi:(S)-ureidoglycine aminohydrolase
LGGALHSACFAKRRSGCCSDFAANEESIEKRFRAHLMTKEMIFGETRTFVGGRHALIGPDGHVPNVLPGVENATTVILISSAMGAAFTQFLVTFNQAGRAVFSADDNERFLFVLDGELELKATSRSCPLTDGGYAFVPAGQSLELIKPKEGTRVNLFSKKYVPLPGVPEPAFNAGREQEIASQPFLGDEAARLQVLLPDNLSFDLAVNIFTYQPGAHLPFVETHIMEHGLLMLTGLGVYRLEDAWYPVAAGDCNWMAPYCPQWFVAMGKSPARYLYYKDVNRPAG